MRPGLRPRNRDVSARRRIARPRRGIRGESASKEGHPQDLPPLRSAIRAGQPILRELWGRPRPRQLMAGLHFREERPWIDQTGRSATRDPPPTSKVFAKVAASPVSIANRRAAVGRGTRWFASTPRDREER